MGKLRKVESESEARRCLVAMDGSGMSLKEWAQARGIDGRSLRGWQMSLQRTAKARSRSESALTVSPRAGSMQLVELVPAKASSPSRYVLRVGPAAVEFGDDFEAETLRRVVEVLCSC